MLRSEPPLIDKAIVDLRDAYAVVRANPAG